MHTSEFRGVLSEDETQKSARPTDQQTTLLTTEPASNHRSTKPTQCKKQPQTLQRNIYLKHQMCDKERQFACKYSKLAIIMEKSIQNNTFNYMHPVQKLIRI